VTEGSAASIDELLQFLYLMPVGVVKFRGDGSVDLMNPMASALLQPLTLNATLGNIYAALAQLVPGLIDQVTNFTSETFWVIRSTRSQASPNALRQPPNRRFSADLQRCGD